MPSPSVALLRTQSDERLGAIVEEAELKISSASREWREIELR
jgi:hypothetical protein